jgi:hypothetical protein
MKEGETTQMLAGDHVNCNARRSSLRRARTPQESLALSLSIHVAVLCPTLTYLIKLI